MFLSNKIFVDLIKSEKGTKLSSRKSDPIECFIHSLDLEKETLSISFSLDLTRFTPIPISLIESIELLGSRTVTFGACEAVIINFIHTEQSDQAALIGLLHQLYEALASEYAWDDSEGGSAEFLKWPPWGPGGGWRHPPWDPSGHRRPGGWHPPWHWSRCAKCKLEVNAFIVGTVFVATSGAGPSALAVAKALFLAKYGEAAWEAVKDILFSATVDVLAQGVCRAIHKC